MCYSPILGAVAQELQQATIPVTDQLSTIKVAPDVIHGQHHMETLAALLHFPGVPAIQYCHGWLPWQEAPVDFPRIRHFVCIDKVGRERLLTRHGVPEERVTTLPNFFDENRFKPRKKPLAAKPAKAMLFSNAFDSKAVPVRKACQKHGLSLDVVGFGATNVHTNPEFLLPNYEIVFARGRAAIEAMACGAAVICCGLEGSGPLITPDNFDRLRALNFGIRTSTGPCEENSLAAQIALYDARRAEQVSVRVRTEATLGATVSRLVNLYDQAIAANQPTKPEDEARAVSQYLRQWSPQFTEWGEKMRQPELLRPANQILQAEVYRLQGEVAELPFVKDELARTKREVREISGSLTWRIPMAIMNWKPFSLLGVFSRGIRKQPKSDVPLTEEEREPNTTSDAVRQLEVRP